MSLVCVWMSSLEKDATQLLVLFYLPAWTQTWTKGPDVFELKQTGWIMILAGNPGQVHKTLTKIFLHLL